LCGLMNAPRSLFSTSTFVFNLQRRNYSDHVSGCLMFNAAFVRGWTFLLNSTCLNMTLSVLADSPTIPRLLENVNRTNNIVESDVTMIGSTGNEHGQLHLWAHSFLFLPLFLVSFFLLFYFFRTSSLSLSSRTL
jgi:hypothetical protein